MKCEEELEEEEKRDNYREEIKENKEYGVISV
jgi:hypothetical protein